MYKLDKFIRFGRTNFTFLIDIGTQALALQTFSNWTNSKDSSAPLLFY